MKIVAALATAGLLAALPVHGALAQERVMAGEAPCEAERGCYVRFTIPGHDELLVLAGEQSGTSCLNLAGECAVVRQGYLAIVNRAPRALKVCLALTFGAKNTPLYVCQDVPARSTWAGECDDCHAQVGGRLVRVAALRVEPVQ